MTISPTHSAWQAIAALAALTHEPINSLASLVERLVAVLPAETPFRSGALLLVPMGQAAETPLPELVADWGLSEAERDALAKQPLPPTENGALLAPSDEGLQRVELRAFGQRIGVLAVRPAGDAPGSPAGGYPELLPLLADQLALLCAGLRARLEPQDWIHQAASLANSLYDLAGRTSLHQYLDEVVLQACQLPFVTTAALYLSEKQGQQPALAASATNQPVRPSLEPLLTPRSASVKSEGQNRSILPIHEGEDVLGALVLYHSSIPEKIGGEYQEALRLFTAQIALALRTNRLSEVQRTQARDLFILYENTRTLNNAPDLGATLDRLCGNVALALRSDHCAVMLWHPHAGSRPQGELEIAGAFDGVNSLEMGSFPVGERFKPAPDSVLGLVISGNRPIAVEDVTADPRFNGENKPDHQVFGFKALLAAPMIHQDQLLGILVVSSYNAHNYPPESMTLIQTLAGQSAIAIGHARLLQDEQQRSSELELLHKLSDDLSSGLNLQGTLDAIARAVERIQPKAWYEICLYDATSQVLTSATRSPLLQKPGADRRSYTLDEGLTGWLARHRRPLRVDDLSQQRVVKAAGDGLIAAKRIRSFVGVPLMVDEQLVGTLELASQQVGAFTHADERLLTIIASQAAQAIQHAIRLETADEGLRGRIRELTALQRISRELVSTLNLDRILAAMLVEAQRVTNAAGGIVLLQNDAARLVDDLRDTKVVDPNDIQMVQDEERTLRLIAVEGYGQAEQAALLNSLRRPEGLLSTLLAQGEAQIIDDLQLEDEQLEISTRSLLLVPVIYEGQVAGLIALGHVQAKAFTRDALNFVRALGDQAALALSNARQFSQLEQQRVVLQQRANLLNQVLEIGNALRADRDIPDLLEQIAFSVVDAAAFRSVLFYMVEAQQEGLLRIIAGAGVPLPELEQLRQQLIVMDTLHPLLDSQFRLGRAYFVPREDAPAGTTAMPMIEQRELAEQPGEGGWQPGDQLLVPLYSTEREMIGLMAVDDPFSGLRPTRRTVETLEIFANQAAIALENARLFKAHETRIQYLSLLNEVGQRLSGVLSMSEIATLVLDRCVETFGFDYALFSLVYEQEGMVRGFDARNLPSGQLEMCFQPLDSPDIMADILRTQKLEVINGWDPRFDRQIFEEFGHDTLRRAFVPFVMRGRSLGSLEIGYKDGVRQVTSDMVPVLATLGNQTATAIENARLFQERERQIHEAETLNRINQAITSTLDLDALLERLHHGLGEILDTNTSFIALYDPAHHTLVYPLAFEQGNRVQLTPTSLYNSDDLNVWVIEHRQALMCGSREEAAQYLNADVLDPETQSYLITPIIAGEEILGVINIRSKERKAFSSQDFNFVSIVTVQAAAAVANAYLFQQREQSIHQLRMLNQIGQALGATVRREDLLRVIYEQTSLVLNTTNFIVALFDDRRQEVSFPLFYERGDPMHMPSRRKGNTLIEYTIKRRQPVLIMGFVEEFMREHKLTQLGDMPASWLGVPMIAADKVIGVIAIQDYERSDAYTEQELRLLSTIANQSAQALENALLFGESRESVRELSTLSETSVSLAGTLEIEEILTIGASSAMELTRADFGGIFMIAQHDEGTTVGETIMLDALHTSIETEGARREVMQVLGTLKPLLEGQPLRVADSLSDQQLKPFAQQFGVRGLALLPIMKEMNLRGALLVGMKDAHEFEDRSLASLHILAAQVGQGMETANLFTQIKRFTVELEEMVAQRTQALAESNTMLTAERDRLEALYRIATELSATLDFNDLLLRTLDLASGALSVHRGSIMLRDRETGKLICRAILRDTGKPEEAYYEVPFNDDQGLANWVILHPESEGVVISDVRTDRRWAKMAGRGDDIRSVIAVPLVSGEATEGVLFFSSPKTGTFTPDHLRFLRAIANEVSVALHNAELYKLIYDTADRLSTALIQQREEAGKNEAILRSVSEGVIVFDNAGTIILYNPASERMLHIPDDKVRGQTMRIFAEYQQEEGGPDRALLIFSGLQEGVRSVEQRDEAFITTLDLGGQMIAANFAPVTTADGSRLGVVAVLRDITREIEADRAKRNFISMVSHELRTPLTPIRGFVDLMLLGAAGQLNDSQREFLTTIKGNTMRMVSLVEDLLEIGRLESGKVVLNVGPTNLTQAIQETVKLLQPEIERKEMQLSVEIVDDFPVIEADSKRIGQVVTNLISNAIKYTFPKGKIWVRALTPDEEHVRIEVQDTGVGVTAEDQKKLFTRFFRTDNPLREEAGGTGLGLSIAKSFVELHTGEMWVESEVGVGSTFIFTLPVQQPRPELGEREDEPGSVASA